MGGIEPLIVLPMAALYFPIVPGHVWPDQFVPDAVSFQMHIKKCGPIPVTGKTVGKFWSIVCLDTFDGCRKRFYQMLHEHGGGIRVVLLKCLHKPPSGVFINSGILEKMLTNDPAVDKTGRRNELHIHLDTLSRMIHVLIGLGDILGVRRMDSHDALSGEETVQASNGAGVAALGELDPENDKPGMRVTSTHVFDQPDLIRSVLVRVVMRPAGEIAQGLDRAIIASFPAVDILPVSFILNSRLRDTEFVRILDKR